jgi:hypothetical protein
MSHGYISYLCAIAYSLCTKVNLPTNSLIPTLIKKKKKSNTNEKTQKQKRYAFTLSIACNVIM